jgi:hypothetical protein
MLLEMTKFKALIPGTGFGRLTAEQPGKEREVM